MDKISWTRDSYGTGQLCNSLVVKVVNAMIDQGVVYNHKNKMHPLLLDRGDAIKNFKDIYVNQLRSI